MNSVSPLDLVTLSSVMKLSEGRPDISVALIDGPVAFDHPALAGIAIRDISGSAAGSCSRLDSAACTHGTFVAGILFARRDSAAPAICPACTALIRPIFGERDNRNSQMPSAMPKELAAAIIDCVDAGARLINLSSSLVQHSPQAERPLANALDYAAQKGVIVVAAAGNQGAVGSSTITRHPGVIPVAACDANGWPVGDTNLGKSIGRHGLRAPGANITSLAAGGKSMTTGGTSAAAAFVTGAIALLWSVFSGVSAPLMKQVISQTGGTRRPAITPPLLDAWASYLALAAVRGRRVA